jgi:hypothetical protein
VRSHQLTAGATDHERLLSQTIAVAVYACSPQRKSALTSQGNPALQPFGMMHSNNNIQQNTMRLM